MKKVKKILNNIKQYFKKVKNNPKKIFIDIRDFVVKNKNVIFMAIPFILMDVMTRVFGNNIGFYKVYKFVPNMFTLLWIMLFLGIVFNLKKIVSRVVYIVVSFIFVLFYLLNNIYYSISSNFFSFNLLTSAKEGGPYIWDAITGCNLLVYLVLIIALLIIIFEYKNIPKNDKVNGKGLLIIIALFIVMHSILPVFLGKSNSSLVWSTWRNPRNIYEQYNDANKSMRISGLYEYTFRNFYVTYLKRKEVSEEDLEFLQSIYSEETLNEKNKYTGIEENKNLILIQLEGIDSWLVDKVTMPNLYNLMANSINFNDHYSFFTGGGSTFNSEFAVNTGFIVPFSYNQNAYAFNNNSFPFTLAKQFKSKGYAVNAFHMNNAEYYSRGINYKNWGYDNYYGLIDMYKYSKNEYKLDRELILNEEYSDLMFPEETNFVDYIITYSPHTPFDNKKQVCKMLYDMDLEEQYGTDASTVEFVQMSEEECARRQASETDYFIGLLIEKLKEKEILDKTVIVAYADHYLYTLEDQSILDNYKVTENNLINKTPFFIYDGKTRLSVNKTTSQLNILPTILNLFGFEFNKSNYISDDALGNSYKGLVFFSDYSWYDGNVYVDGGEITNGKWISDEELEEKNYLVGNLTKKNDLTLKYNYLKKISVNK